MTKQSVKWGILSAGKIAGTFAEALKEAEGSDLHAVAARDAARAAEFAGKHGATRSYGSYETLLADPEVEAVYVATLHPFHLEWIIKSLQAGKHVLCEKPLTMNLREAKRAKQQADENRCLLREAFMYRHHPQMHKVVDLVEGGAIGKVRMIEANFCYHSDMGPDSRLIAKELGGGAILDIGCYGMSFCRLVAGRARDRLFAEPIELQAVGHLDTQARTDLWTTAIMRFEGDILAKTSAALRVEMPNLACIYGETGRITITEPWHCKGELRVEGNGGENPEVTPTDTSRHLYAYEIESFTQEMQGQPIGAKEVAMRYDDTLGNMKALDRWRAEIGLSYEADRVNG
ncbi:gfo/Idh/MocA family oxidoreductase [Coraliomargarita sinensis]|uniref:Gfo/Idh/MocA family oxidoreductase n=1 Tax=Coraliomargarita sinensis TaxID=2174842 RepID=A0A317ZJD9_9BACT|nr:Gfo/Idh/MocA family oxidoreductase [Coraliomargarita sinensis]PXA05112.1 gfo/Idh/MocA family oxidoreductase [Coraliomargarita sinensis]